MKALNEYSCCHNDWRIAYWLAPLTLTAKKGKDTKAFSHERRRNGRIIRCLDFHSISPAAVVKTFDKWLAGARPMLRIPDRELL